MTRSTRRPAGFTGSKFPANLFADGIDGWWLDASEPELSSTWGEFRNFTTAAGPGFKVFNAYPLMHTTAVYQGQRAETSDKRVFILTRSAYAGQQRNAAVTWSGDIHGTWPVFQRQIPAGLNFSISGIPYWNTDTGGFFAGDPARSRLRRIVHALVPIQRLLPDVPRAWHRTTEGDVALRHRTRRTF